MIKDMKSAVYTFIVIMVGVFMYLAGYQTAQDTYKKETAIDALKGNNPYSMEIIYKTHVVDGDTTHTDVDTLFVKKSNIKDV